MGRALGVRAPGRTLPSARLPRVSKGLKLLRGTGGVSAARNGAITGL